MSLSDMLYFGGFSSKGAPSQNGDRRPDRDDHEYLGGGSSGGGSSGGNLGPYLYLKNEMTKQFKEHIKQTNGSYSSFQPTNVEPPSCAQGSSYMETVPLKVPASCSH